MKPTDLFKIVTALIVLCLIGFVLKQKELFFRIHSLNAIEFCRNDHNRQRHVGAIQNLVSRFTNSNSLEGIVWPKIGLLDDRIEKQLDFIREYGKMERICPSSRKTVLRVGKHNFDFLLWEDGFQRMLKDECPVSNCWFTSNMSLAKTADAVVISDMNETLIKALTPKPSHQIWISQHQEAPLRDLFDATPIRKLVNWSASLRPESTFVIPYAHWIKVKESNKTTKTIRNYAKGKTKKIIWIVSNCKDKNGRMNYTMELRKFIDVDVLGKCGKPMPVKCVKHYYTCLRTLVKPYKFYLSFENSNCIGYITEKLHQNALLYNVVPVVMGARPEDYEAVAPAGSYIHVEDFQSPKELAQYLKILDRDDNLYNKYFQYKEHYKYVSRGDTKYWCRVCALLHLKDDVNYVHWYDDYIKWWNGACYARKVENQRWMTWKGVTPERL